jgi:hypothetical protein
MISLSKAILFIALLALAPAAAAQPVLPGTGGGTAGGAPSGLIAKITAQQLAKILGDLSIDGKPVKTSIKTFDDNTAVVVLPLWGDDLYSGVLTEFCEKEPLPDGHRWDSSPKIRFAPDSPLEGDGFEPSVPVR